MNGNSGKMLPIFEIANKLGIPGEFLEPCGKYTAKIKLDFLLQPSQNVWENSGWSPQYPTEYGEGKPSPIGLAQALEKCGRWTFEGLR
jgi:formyltetrahydrofolate synthetase